MLLIAVIVSVAGYTLGRFSILEERVTTTTTSTLTTTQTTTSSITTSQVTTSSTTIIETETKTTTSITTTVSSMTSFPFHKVELDDQIEGIMRENGRILVTLSINGSVFHYGETVNITAALTNMTPQNLTVRLVEFHLPVFTSQGNEVWRTPIDYWPAGRHLRPQQEYDMDLKPFETVRIPYASNYWNFTGLQISNETNRAVYSGILVPEGEYIIDWELGIAIKSGNFGAVNKGGYIDSLILEFTIEK
jgi:hypothetical protein